ncbi:retinitis pigmentosa GTPase regulator b isoform X2 [Brachyhypopomus gauderio]|uniref:retinitis pigmentosa GTPase regulator b isoform X2 n=1 Tax=Brachyhypopomus gauderio TaxID=698409 RepID=UPI0040415D5E
MAGESEDDIPESGAVFTFGKSKFADNIPSKFWLKNDVPLTVACGDEHTALITENGKLFMFGSNNWGQLGLGSKNSVNKPTCVKALKSEKVMLVACGRTHTLVYTSCGNLYGAGGNNDGQLGLGDCEERTSFQLIDFFTKKGPIKMLSAGSNTSAALLQDGRLFMWGDNSEGQIGLGEEDCAWTPQELPAQNRVNWVSCGYYHSAFVTVDGALFTFGEKDSGKLGLSAEQLTNHRVPQQVAGMSEHVLQVACGGGHTVVLTDDCLYTFGLGQYGQLGHGTFIFESRSPRLVEHFSKGRVKHIVCGENHTAVVTESGLLYTFGDGRHGKLGLGEENFTNQFQPTLCPRLLIYHVQSVTCGGCHMVVLAKPRVEGSNDIILEEGDIRENYMETARPFGETGGPLTLSRSLSARVRRRERECSEQFGMMFQTLPPLSSGYLRESLPVSSHTLPPRLQSKRAPSGLEENGFTNRRDMMIKDKVDGKSVPDENSGDSESVKGLGETTDLLNLTHVMKVDPGDKTLTLSPVHKNYSQKTTDLGEETNGEEDQTEEEDDDDDDDEDEGEEDNIQKEPLENTEQQETNTVQLRTQEDEEGGVEEGVSEGSVPDGPVKRHGEEPLQALTEASHPVIEEKSQFQTETKQEKKRGFFGSNNKISVFKRRTSTRVSQEEEKAEVPHESTTVSSEAVSSSSHSRGPEKNSSMGSGSPRPPRSSSATCALL